MLRRATKGAAVVKIAQVLDIKVHEVSALLAGLPTILAQSTAPQKSGLRETQLQHRPARASVVIRIPKPRPEPLPCPLIL
jgi:hypothetical protein